MTDTKRETRGPHGAVRDGATTTNRAIFARYVPHLEYRTELMCGKQAFASVAEARKLLVRLRKTGKTQGSRSLRPKGQARALEIYRCHECQEWHVGHKK
jgi:hypothetical protein